MNSNKTIKETIELYFGDCEHLPTLMKAEATQAITQAMLAEVLDMIGVRLNEAIPKVKRKKGEPLSVTSYMQGYDDKEAELRKAAKERFK